MTKRSPLPEIKVSLSRTQSDERAVPVDYPDNLGLRTKLGGVPDWIQEDQTPDCDLCRGEMIFVGQIDSIEHDSGKNPLRKDCLGHQDYMFGDVGMIYVFFCFECCKSASVFQCY
jgi:hypothetical protein